MHKAYGIGTGISLPTSGIWKKEPPEIKLTTVLPFTIPHMETGIAVGKRAKRSGQSEMKYPCPEPQCFYTAYSFADLEEHVALGIHDPFVGTTKHDKIKLKWVTNVENLASTSHPRECSTITAATPSESEMGWALKHSKPRKRHSARATAHVKLLWERGNISGQKSDPADVAHDMRTSRQPNGSKTFTPDEWLTTSQVTSIFARLTLQHKKGGITFSAEPDDHHDVESYNLRVDAREALM